MKVKSNIPVPGQPNICQCGCGEEIPWKTTAGLPRQYKDATHRGRERARRFAGTLSPGARRWTTEEVQALTPETIKTVPEDLLYGILNRTRLGGNVRTPEFIAMICDEARRRNMDHAMWIVNSLQSPACHCGKPGHYIVGRITFCYEHAMTEGAKMRAGYGQRLEARAVAKDRWYQERQRVRDAARKHHEARGQK